MIEDVYVLTNKQLAQTSNGKHYIKAFISDRTTQITARMWNASRDIFQAMPESGASSIGTTYRWRSLRAVLSKPDQYVGYRQLK